MWPHSIFLKSCLLERKVSLSRTRVIRFNLSIENPVNISHPWKFIFEKLHSFFLFFLATRSWQKTWIDTSEPYTRAMRGIMHGPQANLGVDQKFSPDRLKTRKGSLKKLGLIKKEKNNQGRVIKDTWPCFNIPITSLSFSTPFEPKHICFLKTTKKKTTKAK